jgi:hypothetical protein
MSLSHSPQIVTDGLVLCLDAANQRSYPKSGTTWSDLSGNGNHGALTNMENNFDAGNKGSLSFDGSNERVAISDHTSIRLSTTGTISMFVNPATRSDTYQTFLSKNNGNYDTGYEIGIDQRSSKNNGLAIRPGSSSNIQNFFTGYLDTWVHVSVVLNGSSVLAYRNGEFFATHAQTTSSTTATLQIGSRGTGSLFVNCKFANIMIHNRALTGDEVRQNYLATRGRYK